MVSKDISRDALIICRRYFALGKLIVLEWRQVQHRLIIGNRMVKQSLDSVVRRLRHRQTTLVLGMIREEVIRRFRRHQVWLLL